MAKLIKREQRPAPLDPEATAAVGDGHGSVGSDEPAPLDPAAQAEALKQRAQAEADQVLASAQQQAQSILAEAHDELERLRASAHEEGLQMGREEGVAQLVANAVQANERIAALENEVRPQIVTLAMAIARRIVGRELEFQPEAVVHIVKQALGEKARQRREITLRVNPSDAQIIRANRAALVEMLSRTKEVAIQEDPNVAPHGVVIETEAGTIDAQLETQLATMERALRAVDSV